MKPLKCLVSKEKLESKFLRSLLYHWLANNPVHNNVSIYLNKKFQLSGTFKEGIKYFETSISQ